MGLEMGVYCILWLEVDFQNSRETILFAYIACLHLVVSF